MSQYDQSQRPIPPDVTPPGQGMSIASLVLGIVSIIFCWTSIFAVVFVITSIVGIVLAVIARKRNAEAGFPAGMATAGLVVNIVALVFTAIGFITCGVCVACISCASLVS